MSRNVPNLLIAQVFPIDLLEGSRCLNFRSIVAGLVSSLRHLRRLQLLSPLHDSDIGWLDILVSRGPVARGCQYLGNLGCVS